MKTKISMELHLNRSNIKHYEWYTRLVLTEPNQLNTEDNVA